MKKLTPLSIGPATIFLFLFNIIIFSLDAFNASIDLLRWSHSPPVESYLVKWGVVDLERIELIVGNQHYPGDMQRNIQYKRGLYDIDCGGNKSGSIVSVKDELEYYYFDYFIDIFLYSRRESYNLVYKQICYEPIEISLLINQPSDSLMGIIIY